MKILQNIYKSNFIYSFQEDKRILIKALKKKKKYFWRFVAPDQIPPFPPNTVLFKSKNDHYAIGTNEKKSFLGRVYEKNIKGLVIIKDNVQHIINDSFFILTKKENNPKKLILEISKKDFLKKIKMSLTKEDILLIEKISKSKFSTLVDEIKKSEKKVFYKIQGNERWIDNKRLNKLGIHLLRCILSERIYQNKFKNKVLTKDIQFYLKNGYLIKKYKNFNSKKIQIFLNNISNTSTKKIIWNKVEFKHIKNDPQYEMHLDSFCNTIKVWMYPGNLKKKNGLLTFFPKSHKLTIKKLEWLYKISCSNIGLKEPSFRLKKKYFKEYSQLKLALPLQKQKTVVIANTLMFHARSNAKAGTKRILYRIQGNNDGGVKRTNPFL
jgi:hypothetical protein